MKVDSVCERIKIWAERHIAQEVTLHISPEGDIQIKRLAHIKTENDLHKEGISTGDAALWSEIA